MSESGLLRLFANHKSDAMKAAKKNQVFILGRLVVMLFTKHLEASYLSPHLFRLTVHVAQHWRVG